MTRPDDDVGGRRGLPLGKGTSSGERGKGTRGNGGRSAWRIALAALAVFAIDLGLNETAVRGVVIHESTLMGALGRKSGYQLRSDQFLGSRFHIKETTEVQAVGGHLLSTEGTLFGAIVSVAGPTALPSGAPFDSSTVASAKFSVGTPSVDFRTPLEVILPPGDYVLVFGSGEFGADGVGSMPVNNAEGPGLSSQVYWGGRKWWDLGVLRARFVVEGKLIRAAMDAYPRHAILGWGSSWKPSANAIDLGWSWCGCVRDRAVWELSKRFFFLP